MLANIYKKLNLTLSFLFFPPSPLLCVEMCHSPYKSKVNNGMDGSNGLGIWNVLSIMTSDFPWYYCNNMWDLEPE